MKKITYEILENLTKEINSQYNKNYFLEPETYNKYVLFLNGKRAGETMNAQECWKVLTVIYAICKEERGAIIWQEQEA